MNNIHLTEDVNWGDVHILINKKFLPLIENIEYISEVYEPTKIGKNDKSHFREECLVRTKKIKGEVTRLISVVRRMKTKSKGDISRVQEGLLRVLRGIYVGLSLFLRDARMKEDSKSSIEYTQDIDPIVKWNIIFKEYFDSSGTHLYDEMIDELTRLGGGGKALRRPVVITNMRFVQMVKNDVKNPRKLLDFLQEGDLREIELNPKLPAMKVPGSYGSKIIVPEYKNTDIWWTIFLSGVAKLVVSVSSPDLSSVLPGKSHNDWVITKYRKMQITTQIINKAYKDIRGGKPKMKYVQTVLRVGGLFRRFSYHNPRFPSIISGDDPPQGTIPGPKPPRGK